MTSCDTKRLLEAVANTWCQMAEFCYEIGDFRAGSPQGCIHVQARMLLARIGGNDNPQPVYWREDLAEAKEKVTE